MTKNLRNITWTFPNKSSEMIGTISQSTFLGPYRIQINKGFLDHYKYPTLRFLAYICGHSDRLYLYKHNDLNNKVLIYDAFTGKQPLSLRQQNINMNIIFNGYEKLINTTHDYDDRVLLQPRITNILNVPISMRYSYHCPFDHTDYIMIENQELFKLENFSRQWFIDPIAQTTIYDIQD